MRARLSALLAALTFAGALPAQDERPDSIETFLRRARERQAALQERLRPQVLSLVSRLESLGRPSSEEAEILRDIAALGGDATPLLIEHVEPGEPATRAKLYRARTLAEALARNSSPALATELIALAKHGSAEGRRLATYVLGRCPPDPRIDAHLRKAFAESDGLLRLECVQSMAVRGGHVELLSSALGDVDPRVVATVLDALAGAKAAKAAPAVAQLVLEKEGAGEVLAEIAAYYTACPEVVTDETIQGLLVLVQKDGPVRARVALLDALPRFVTSLSSQQRAMLSSLEDADDTRLREATLLCLALMNDRRARRQLLRVYDKEIEEREGSWQGYERRGDLFVRLGDWDNAIKDYKKSIGLVEPALRASQRELWIKLARCYVEDGKLRQALETLEDFGWSRGMLQRVKRDPSFEPLIEHARYGKRFREG